jgi:hypothetical protein
MKLGKSFESIALQAKEIDPAVSAAVIGESENIGCPTQGFGRERTAKITMN